jgi:hypothetical protein
MSDEVSKHVQNLEKATDTTQLHIGATSIETELNNMPPDKFNDIVSNYNVEAIYPKNQGKYPLIELKDKDTILVGEHIYKKGHSAIDIFKWGPQQWHEDTGAEAAKAAKVFENARDPFTIAANSLDKINKKDSTN